MSRAKKRAVIIAALVVFAAAAAALGVYDRSISDSYFKTASRYGGFFEVAGEPPAILLAIYCFNVLASSERRGGWRAFWTVFGACVWAYLLSKLCVSFASVPIPLWIALAAGSALEAVSALCFALWMRRRHAGYLAGGEDAAIETLRSACAKAAVACVFTLAAVSSVKAVWGRVRPRDVSEDAPFSFFWSPRFFSGNYSFPSGHTANAASLGALTFFVSGRRARGILWLLLAVWIGAVAFSRVRGGAHFPTDVLFGAAIGLLGVAISPRLTPLVYPEAQPTE